MLGYILACSSVPINETDKVHDLVHAKPNISTRPLAGNLISADSLAKMFYFTIMTDLGQVETGPNPLVDPALVEYYSRNITLITKEKESVPDKSVGVGKYWDRGVKADNGRGGKTVEVGCIHPSTIATTYLCQVPKLKSSGTLFVSVLINDIVLLSVLCGGCLSYSWAIIFA